MTRRRLLLAITVWVAFGLVCLLGGKAKADELASSNQAELTQSEVVPCEVKVRIHVLVRLILTSQFPCR
jgi:hypothetical protein